MKTLKELFDEHGSVWLAYENSPDKKAIRPLDYSERSRAYIICESVCDITPYSSCTFNDSKTGFVLHTPPKKTVRKYLWTVRYPVTLDSFLETKYMTEERAKIRYGDSEIKRMDDLFLDVEE